MRERGGQTHTDRHREREREREGGREREREREKEREGEREREREREREMEMERERENVMRVRLKIFSGCRSGCCGLYLWTSSGMTTDGGEGVFYNRSGTEAGFFCHFIGLCSASPRFLEHRRVSIMRN